MIVNKSVTNEPVSAKRGIAGETGIEEAPLTFIWEVLDTNFGRNTGYLDSAYS
jgi:hypothetical protein